MSISNIINLKTIMFRVGTLRLTRKHAATFGYCALLLLPFIAAESLGMVYEGLYSSVLGAITLIAMTAFFVQFPLAGRLKAVPLFSNIDWSVAKHKRLGQYLGLFFFVHPLLILAPKMMMSFDDFSASFISMLTAPQLLTGLIAWLMMLAWVLMAIYKDKLTIRYETWRLLHIVGFGVITTLATLHVTTVGSHGQFNAHFNGVWWALYMFSILLLVYNYLIKPRKIQRQPFAITAINKISTCDWQLTIKPAMQQRFAYEAGQFAWLNTSGSAYNLEQHPFSIASEHNDQAHLSFIIRELGDYTSSLAQLSVGQTVFVDGPYGSMSLAQSSTASGITLIAGGAGIAPMVSLLRELAKRNDARPIRLIYANKNLQRMVCIDELIALEQSMHNFKLQLVCEQVIEQKDVNQVYRNGDTPPLDIQQGYVDKPHISASISAGQQQDWSVYLCGPEAMMTATSKHLTHLGISSGQVHFEQLAF
ncbi:ferredoxin reductase family protein [Shewanella youngdeokensis]|uniref:Ferric reductase-like transmembrane domain-containing protein n=1 Tax=Shewanella youngdeokensis TaxID=2999068 RepID=A0ABZ0JV92_9GAMM|nr:ferric reductase-like transmembrane domain-containing protein [Shewanella sp. DAU334]